MIGVGLVTTLTKDKILDGLRDKETRELFAEEHISTGLPFQIHGLREKLGLTQAELARRAGMAQERISVLEDPNYEFLPKIPTLIKLANVFDVPLIVKFGSWLELFDWETNLSPERLAPRSFDEEIDALQRAASTTTTTYTVPVETYAALFPSTVFHRIQEAPLIWAALTGTEPFAYRRASHESGAFNVEELVAAAVGENTSLGFIVEASEVAEEKNAPTSGVIDSLIPISSDTSIIDYSALRPAA
jgi:transcriptional regulator with XRE-family HTH domain